MEAFVGHTAKLMRCHMNSTCFTNNFLDELFHYDIRATESHVTAAFTVFIGALTLLTFLVLRYLVFSPSGKTSQPGNLSEGSPEVTISKILVHPIKSCRGTSVPKSKYDESGLVYDRKFAIIDAITHEVITARTHPKMILIHPTIDEDFKDENAGTLVISFPSESACKSFRIPLLPCSRVLNQWQRLDDVKLWGRQDIDGHICQCSDRPEEDAPAKTLSKFLGREVLLVAKGWKERPCHTTFDFPNLKAKAMYQDGYPLLIASEESLVSVQERMRREIGNQGVADHWVNDDLVMERFRPNIVTRDAGVPWAEDSWETIQIGSHASTICLVSKCTRCLLPNVDPDTGVRDAAVPFKILMKFRTGKDPTQMNKPCFGCNAVPSGTGAICVGDRVKILTAMRPT